MPVTFSRSITVTAALLVWSLSACSPPFQAGPGAQGPRAVYYSALQRAASTREVHITGAFYFLATPGTGWFRLHWDRRGSLVVILGAVLPGDPYHSKPDTEHLHVSPSALPGVLDDVLVPRLRFTARNAGHTIWLGRQSIIGDLSFDKLSTVRQAKAPHHLLRIISLHAYGYPWICLASTVEIHMGCGSTMVPNQRFRPPRDLVYEGKLSVDSTTGLPVAYSSHIISSGKRRRGQEYSFSYERLSERAMSKSVV